MISLILLAGLVVLFAAHRNLLDRIRLLEQQLAELRAPGWLHEATPAPARELAEPAPWAPPPPPREPGIAWEPEVPPVRETLATLFERFVAGRLLIWVGGISLAVAGVFLVRYSIEIGLVTPPVRMLIAAGFGLLLIGAGEAARRYGSADPRTAQALVGAGIFVLYAAVYGSLTLYGLIALGTAALLMALITAAALLLSLRHGAPTAVMALTGGFLTPLLVGDPEAGPVPLLGYLALLNAGLFALAQRRDWSWLAAAAVALSFVWTAVLLAEPDAEDALASGLFIVALGIAASLARPGDGKPLRLMQPAAIALVQLALLVGRQDLGIAAWALFGTLAIACLILATRGREFRLLPPLALLLALILLLAEVIRGGEPLTPLIAAAITLLFAGFAWIRAGGGERTAWSLIACAALAAPAIILRIAEPERLSAAGWGGVMIVLALASGALFWRQRGSARPEGVPDWGLAAAAATTLLLLAFAVFEWLPRDWVPIGWLVLATAAAALADRMRELGAAVAGAVLGAAAIAMAAALVPDLWWTTSASLIGVPALASGLPTVGRAILLLVVPGAMLFALTRLLTLLTPGARRAIAAAAITLLLLGLYVPAKQIFGLTGKEDFVAHGFAERTLITQALFVTGWLLARYGRTALGRALTVLATWRFLWFDLIVHNPAWASQWIGGLPLLNLLPAYFGSAWWLYRARQRAGATGGAWLALALAALIAGVMLMVRQLFQGGLLNGPEVPRGEFYAYSLAGLLLSVAMLLGGIRLPDKALRVAGLALLTATVLKVFLIDAAELEGLLRILSFLGLGIALIGVGKLYARVLNAEAPPAPASS